MSKVKGCTSGDNAKIQYNCTNFGIYQNHLLKCKPVICLCYNLRKPLQFTLKFKFGKKKDFCNNDQQKSNLLSRLCSTTLKKFVFKTNNL